MTTPSHDAIRLGVPASDMRQHYENVLWDALSVVWRRRWLVLILPLLATLSALLVLPMLERRYVADSLIEIEVGKREPALAGAQAPNMVLEAKAVVEGEARIIRSRAIARRVVERLDLVNDPVFAPQPSAFALPAWLAPTAAWLFPPVSRERRAGGGAAATAASPTDLVALGLLKRLRVDSDDRAYLISISVTTGNPETSARIANAFAEEYLNSRIETNVAAAGAVSDWLSAQLVETRANLRAAEQALQAERERTGLINAAPDGSSALQQQHREASAQLSAASAARRAVEARLERARQLVGTDARPLASDLADFQSLRSLIDAEAQAVRDMADLSSQFGEKHPRLRRAQATLQELRAQIATEMAGIVAGIETHVASARSAERMMERRVAALEQARIAGKSDEARLAELESATQRLRDRVQTLASSYEQAAAIKDLKPLNAHVVMRAEPVSLPVSPKPGLILGLTGLGALAAAIGLALLLERRDQGFRTTAEIGPATGYRALGMVPELPAREFRRRSGPPGPVAAMFREAIGAVGAIVGTGKSRSEKVVLVTSAVPGEGKSVMISALAHALIGRGLRVLVVDNRPESVGGDSRAVTFPLETVYENDDAGRDFFLSRAGEPLCVLDRAAAPRHAPNGFMCQAFETMLREARARYDVILVEGPPVMLMADSLVLARQADLVIHVARWHSTPRKVVAAALERLEEVRARIAGVVITRVDMRAHRKYSFLDQVYFYRRYHRVYKYGL